MVIDCHAHIFETYPKARWDRLCGQVRLALGDEGSERWKARFSGTVEALLRDMDEAGVDISIVICDDNEYTAEAQRKYPDRIIGYASVRAATTMKEAVKLVETGITKLGLKGVKIMPKAPLTDESYRELMDRINELEVPCLIHLGTSPNFYIENGNPNVLDALSLRYPKMRFQAAHIARGYEDLLTATIWERKGMATQVQGKIVTDLAMLQPYYVESPWHFTMQMRYLMDRIPRQIVMGTDWPFATLGMWGGLSHKEWFDTIRNLKIPKQFLQVGLGIKDFSQEEKERVLGENAREFLGI